MIGWVRHGIAGPRRVAALRDIVSLAVSAFSMPSLDVSRRFARAGIMMLRWSTREGTRTFRQIILYAADSWREPASPLFWGWPAWCISLARWSPAHPGAVCLWAASNKTNARAKWLMHATVCTVPIFAGLMVYDKLPH